MKNEALCCYDRAELYRPQWAFSEPAGVHDELFIVGPFSLVVEGTGALTLNLPVQLDDDVSYFIRAIYFGQLNPNNGVIQSGILVRMRDNNGNMLTDGLILALGAWSNALDGDNAFGFTLEPEVECAPGGTILFDFQLGSQGGAAEFTKALAPGSIVFNSAIGGAGGNGSTIELLHVAAPNVPLSVAVTGRNVVVTLQTNGASAIISTAQDVASIINNTPAVQAVMFALLFTANPAQVITALAVSALTGGVNGSPVTLTGTLIGVKRFERCKQ